MHWTDDAAKELERITGDPLADAALGAVRILTVSQPEGRSKYQECTLEVITDAPGVAPTTVRLQLVTTRAHWPEVGAQLPARISVSDPRHLEVDWDALAR